MKNELDVHNNLLLGNIFALNRKHYKINLVEEFKLNQMMWLNNKEFEKLLGLEDMLKLMLPIEQRYVNCFTKRKFNV